MKINSLKYVFWDAMQLIFGADQGKQNLHFNTLKPFKDARILDFACSTGNASAIFKDYNYTGLDIDSKAISYALGIFDPVWTGNEGKI